MLKKKKGGQSEDRHTYERGSQLMPPEDDNTVDSSTRQRSTLPQTESTRGQRFMHRIVRTLTGGNNQAAAERGRRLHENDRDMQTFNTRRRRRQR